VSRLKSVLTGVSGVDTVVAGGMLTSFARHEPAAVQEARRACRLGRRTPPRTVGLGAGAEGMRGPEAARPAGVGRRVDAADRRWSAAGCSPAGFGRRAGPEPVGARPAGVVRLRLSIVMPPVPHTAPALSRSRRP
jgi:hypothetical protein